MTITTFPVGPLTGILAGYYDSWLERVLMCLTDAVTSALRSTLAFTFAIMLGLGLVSGALVLTLTTWPACVHQARSEIQRLRHSDYLVTVEMISIRGRCPLIGHILPLRPSSATAHLVLGLVGIILTAVGLGFLGLGARPPMAEWGVMVTDGIQVILDQWWITTAPGTTILITSPVFNPLGDGLRDVLEPQHD